MTELKRVCPFCGGEMIGTNGHPICHYNPDCIIHDESVPQELLDLLADTKKKLDRYENALTFIRNIKGDGLSYSEMCIDMTEVAKKALNPEYSMVLLGRYLDEYLLSNLEQINKKEE